MRLPVSCLLLWPHEGDDGVQAFLLVIACEFHSEMDRDAFLREFGRLAKFVGANENDTLAYETAVADTNPLKVLIYER